MRKWRAVPGNREKANAYSRAWRKAHSDRQYASDVKGKYGLTVERRAELEEQQGGVCAICRGREEGKRLAVDHDHDTGRVRGLLCRPCNVVLGIVGESIDRLQSMQRYLQEVS